MKYLFINIKRSLVMMAVAFLISCSGEKSFEETYVGNWFGEETSDDYLSRYIYNVRADSTFAFRSVDFDPNEKKTYRSNAQGVWSYKDGILTETFTVVDGVKVPEKQQETVRSKARFIDDDTLEVIVLDSEFGDVLIINKRVDKKFVIPDPSKH